MLWALLVFSVNINVSFAQKITAEEVLAKHLDSIGSVKNRDAVKSRVIVSDVEYLYQSQNPIVGQSIVASTTEGAIFGINLNATNYRFDKFSYDGKKVRVGFINPGARSPLGGFIFSYGDVLKKGLLGGTLSSSWALLSVEARKSRLNYAGTDKIDGKETHVIEYLPKGGADVNIKMYFDAENFRHLRSEYYRVVAAPTGSDSVSSATSRESRYRLVEDFSKYKKSRSMSDE